MPRTLKDNRLWIVTFGILSLTGCDKVFSANQSSPAKPLESTSKDFLQEPLVFTNKIVNSPQDQKDGPVESKPASLAQVGKWRVTAGEFKEWLKLFKKMNPDSEVDLNNKEQVRKILLDLVNLQLLTQEAERRDLARKKGLRLALDVAKSNVLVPELASTIVGDVSVSDQEVQDFYKENKDTFAAPAEWKVREIVVDAEETAKALLVDLYKGSDFEETAKLKSKSKSSWKKGDLGYKTTFDFSKMESVVKTLEVGDISGVFKGPEGFYIVKLEDKRGGEPKKISEVKEDIKTGLLLLKQQQVLKEFIDKLKEKTELVVNEKLLQE